MASRYASHFAAVSASGEKKGFWSTSAQSQRARSISISPIADQRAAHAEAPARSCARWRRRRRASPSRAPRSGRRRDSRAGRIWHRRCSRHGRADSDRGSPNSPSSAGRRSRSCSEIGVPVVTSPPVVSSSNTPERIFTCVRLAPLRGEARLAGPALVEEGLDLRLGDRDSAAGSRRPRSRSPARGSRPRW